MAPNIQPEKQNEKTAEERLFHCKVYYEDTDCMGVVYHANYLKFMERGRTEFVETSGRTIAEWNDLGVLVVVYSMNRRWYVELKA